MKIYIGINENLKHDSAGFVSGQVAHALSLMLYHGYIKKDWHAEPALPSRKILDDYFDTHIVKIMVKLTSEQSEKLINENYLVILDKHANSDLPKIPTCVYLGMFDNKDTPKWIKELPLF